MTDLQERFCEEYIVDLNATQAYIRAGYKARGAAARTNSSRLLTNADIQERIRELQEKRSKRTEITADRVLKELALIGFADPEHYRVDDEGNLTLTDDAPAEATRALASVDRDISVSQKEDRVERDVKVKIRLWNKNTALQDLGKHLGLFGPKGTEEDPVHVAPIRVNIVNQPSE